MSSLSSQQQQPQPSSSSDNPSLPAAKKQRIRYVPPPPLETELTSAAAAAADLCVLHQDTKLGFVYSNTTSNNNDTWNAWGRTSLYVVVLNTNESDNRQQPLLGTTHRLALHLRRTCRVKNVIVETMVTRRATDDQKDSTEENRMQVDGEEHEQQHNNHNDVGLASVYCSFTHDDPLAHVLVKPAGSYTAALDDDDDDKTSMTRLDADTQSNRDAMGMTNSLRAASIASNMGELRIAIPDPTKVMKQQTDETTTTSASSPNHVPEEPAFQLQQFILDPKKAEQAWIQEIMSLETTADSSSVAASLRTTLHERSTKTRQARIALVARRLAEATDKPSSNTNASAANEQKDTPSLTTTSKTPSLRAFKVTIEYDLNLDLNHHHLGGIHALRNPTPHVYTTAGIVGDHEGPRCWVPCCDSASSFHRSSHEWCIMISAPFNEGLSVVGCGEDFGVSRTHLHSANENSKAARELLGDQQIDCLQSLVMHGMERSNGGDGEGDVHVIPPDASSSLGDSVMATCTWLSQAWTPTSPRSLGFAIGPFKILEDPEYFGVDGDEGEDEEEAATTNGIDRQEFVDTARAMGEGIRQVYFAPLFERKFLHSEADASLLTSTEIQLAPLSRREKEMSKRLDEAVLYSTAGVPHRALSSMRDVLALPAYRTASYTQVWIPNAVHGGVSSGALHCSPDVLVNPFLGGSIMDSRLLPQPGYRLPFHHGGRALQLLQARCAVRGWITCALPLGGGDDVGLGYIHRLVESFLISLYERGHGAYGEGGAKGSVFFTKRYAAGSGLNSSNFDFLPVHNFEEGELDMVAVGAVGAVPTEDRNNTQLWRTAANGTESHTSALDEFSIRQLLYKDAVEALERGTDKDKQVPSPSMGWLGSHLSLSFLSSNACSSSDLGCGAVELAHPIGGVLYRSLKCEILRQIIESRAGIANCIRLVRAAFIAARMEDLGKKEVRYVRTSKKGRDKESRKEDEEQEKKTSEPQQANMQPPFVVCVEEMLKNHGLTHTLFTRALRIIAGPSREPFLRGTLVDCERELRRSGTHRQFVDPEGFPNSYVRGAAGLYLRVGVHVETADKAAGGSSTAAAGAVAVKGTQLHVLVEPVIPEGGIAFGGQMTLRVVENEGQLREFARTLKTDGSRSEWGPIFLHAKPVTTVKQQTAASGVIETTAKEAEDGSSKQGTLADRVFTDTILHGGGYQAIELARLTNLTPLLWVRVDPMGMYGGRVSIVQPDSCLAEQLFHDGEAMAQVDAIRALAERPLPVQTAGRIKQVYDVEISELPVRVLGDCLRGSPALHSSLPHTPAVRAQAAYAIAQWQNNKAPASQDVVGTHAWIGLSLLIQYFKERYYNNGIIVPVKFTRLVLKSNEANFVLATSEETGKPGKQSGEEELYQYVDTIEGEMERKNAVEEAEDIEIEEDEECRVRSAVITAIASVRAQNGMTPRAAIDFLEAVLVSGDATMVRTLASTDEAAVFGEKYHPKAQMEGDQDLVNHRIASLTYSPSPVVGDALLALCHVNASPPIITDPATGKPIQATERHPVLPLIDASRRWLEWELCRETIRGEVDGDNLSAIGGNAQNIVAACAIMALSSLSILRQTTLDASGLDESKDSVTEPATTKFYIDIFDGMPRRSDVTRAACAQAVACICCAADRFELEKVDPLGLLTALEFLLDRILDPETSPGLRQTLALIMLDTCTGKICSTQRVGAVGGRADLCVSAARFLNGPLGASHGGDNGSAILTTVTETSYPAASAVNDGARRGLRLLSRAGHPREELSDLVVVRVAKFATSLWRTINGDCTPLLSRDRVAGQSDDTLDGVCAFDGQLRVSLLSLWHWIWPKGCLAVLRVQALKPLEGTQRYKELGAHLVMQISDEEKEAALAEDTALVDIDKAVLVEQDRQRWRGEMASRAYSYAKEDSLSSIKDTTTSEQGLGLPLPPIQRDNAFKQGGWVASAAQQRRALALDGGHAVKKIRLTVKASSGAE